MPAYIYQSKITGRIVEVYQGINDPHVYSENNEEFERVWQSLNAATDTKWNPDSPYDFAEKSRNKKGSLNDLWEKSRELSVARERKYGRDNKKNEYYSNWSKKRNGKQHPDLQKAAVKSELAKQGIIIE